MVEPCPELDVAGSEPVRHADNIADRPVIIRQLLTRDMADVRRAVSVVGYVRHVARRNGAVRQLTVGIRAVQPIVVVRVGVDLVVEREAKKSRREADVFVIGRYLVLVVAVIGLAVGTRVVRVVRAEGRYLRLGGANWRILTHFVQV
jgi:hypothetical protein